MSDLDHNDNEDDGDDAFVVYDDMDGANEHDLTSYTIDNEDEEDMMEPRSKSDNIDADPFHGANNNSSSNHDSTRQQAMLRQFQTTLLELQEELKESRAENERLQMDKETMAVRSMDQIEALNVEVEHSQNESQQYEMRYQEMSDEYQELKREMVERASSGQDSDQLQLILDRQVQKEKQLLLANDMANEDIEKLRATIKGQTKNTSTLQKGLVAVKKENAQLQKNLNAISDKYELLQQKSASESAHNAERRMQLERENEIYRQNLSQAEEDRVAAETEFTERTMEMLVDDLNDNDAHSALGRQQTRPLRLNRVETQDLNLNHRRQNDSVDSNMGGATGFIKQRFASQVSLPDENSLLYQGMNDQMQMGDGDYAHSRHGSQMSMAGYGGVDPIKLKQDIRDILASDIKTILEEQQFGGNNSHSEEISMSATVSDIREQMQVLLDQTKRKSIDLSKVQRKEPDAVGLTEDAMQQMVDDLKLSVQSVLDEKLLPSVEALRSEHGEVRVAVEQSLRAMTEEMENGKGGDSRDTKSVLQEAIQSQMTTSMIALENQIGSAVADSVREVIDDKIGDDFRRDLQQGVVEQMAQMKELFASGSDSEEKQKQKESAASAEAMGAMLGDRLDALVGDLKDSLMPDIEALLMKVGGLGGLRVGDNDGDEKEELSEEELRAAIGRLEAELVKLRQEKDEHDGALKAAATSKVHQVVKLQNLLDHMRNDNRSLQFQVEKYRKKFVEIRQAQEKTVTNRLWGLWNGNGNGNGNDAPPSRRVQRLQPGASGRPQQQEYRNQYGHLST